LEKAFYSYCHMNDCCLTTPRVRRWLAHSQEARILNLFTDVCNLVNQQGQVLSLVTRRIGAGPFTLVLGGRPAWPASAGDRVRIDRRAGRLYAGPLAVDYSQARSWQPRPEWPRLRRELPGPAAGDLALPPEITRLLQQLLDGICHKNEVEVRQAVVGLAGRGHGLTPTGDDLLVGILYALWVWRPGSAWPALIAGSATPRTTTLSAAFLEAAAAGEATAPWHRLALGDGRAVSEIRATGHRSGAETWAGFVAAGARLSHEPC